MHWCCIHLCCIVARWFKYISDAAEAYKSKEAKMPRHVSTKTPSDVAAAAAAAAAASKDADSEDRKSIK